MGGKEVSYKIKAKILEIEAKASQMLGKLYHRAILKQVLPKSARLALNLL